MDITRKALIISILLLSIVGCYSTERARPAEVEAAQALYTAANGIGAFDPCHHNYRICLPGESPTDNDHDFCAEARCRGGHILRLDFLKTQLKELPSEIGELTHLQYLKLSGNQLVSLPAEIGHLSSLEGLDLRDNQLVSLPPEIGQLSNLRWLDLEGNQLASLPPEIGQLTRLESLTLKGNPLSGPLPAWLNDLALEHFDFRETSLCIPSDDRIEAWLMSIKYIEGLSVRNACPTSPEQQAALASLYEITGHREGWSLGTSPCTWTGIGCSYSGNITSLDLPYANLTELPPAIGQLTRLELLRLSYNQLTGLPSEIGRLTHLKTLNLDNNRLASLPPEIGHLRNLESLDLMDNQLTELPAELGQLTRLRWLEVSDNPLTGPLPAFLTALPPESLVFIFEDTDLCVPDDSDFLDWMKRLRHVDATAYQWLLEHRGCDEVCRQ